MTPTKTARTIIASVSLPAGNTNSAARDLTTCFGGTIMTRVTNGATGPTVAATVTINVSVDGSTWRKLVAIQSNTGNNVITDIPVNIDASIMHVQVSITGNTAQAVTVESYFQELTSIG